MSSGPVISQCQYLRHLDPGAIRPRCAAFSGGIPATLYDGKADHRKPHEGDRGLRFEPRGEVPAHVQARLYARLDFLDLDRLSRDFP